MQARPAAACGRGALFVSSPSVPTKGWLDGLCTVNPGLSVCGSHRRRTPSSCAGQNYAAAWLQRKTHASTPVVSLRQMGCRGGRVASTMPIPPGPAYRFCTIGRLICCRPKWAWSVGMRHIGIASCAWCTSFAGRCRALVAPRRMRPWQTRSGTRHGGDSHRLANCQSSGSA
jgi:hypothetical protein